MSFIFYATQVTLPLDPLPYLRSTMKIFYTFAIAALITASCAQSDTKENTHEQTESAVSIDYQAKGDSLTSIAQALLLKNVQSAMKSGGPVHAIDFCNVRATPLMDSLSQAQGVKISRISVDYRNRMNKPSSRERALLLELQTKSKADTLIAENNTYYKSIKVFSSACLKCHGSVEEDIALATLNKIREVYPSDYAVGYSLGDYRGAWKVEFDANHRSD